MGELNARGCGEELEPDIPPSRGSFFAKSGMMSATFSSSSNLSNGSSLARVPSMDRSQSMRIAEDAERIDKRSLKEELALLEERALLDRFKNMSSESRQKVIEIIEEQERIEGIYHQDIS